MEDNLTTNTDLSLAPPTPPSQRPCLVCKRPVSEWVMAHRGDRCCSQFCETALQEQEEPGEEISSASPPPEQEVIEADGKEILLFSCPGCGQVMDPGEGRPGLVLFKDAVWHRVCAQGAGGRSS